MDLQTATREELIARIVEQDILIAQLLMRIAVLKEQGTGPGIEPPDEGDDPPVSAPTSVKPNRPPRERKPRQRRSRGYARKRSRPTRRVVHAVEQCRQCGCQMAGGSVKRTREVLHIPLVPVEVIEHVFLERRCPLCHTRQTPGAEVLRGGVLGRHRVSLQTVAEQGRARVAEIRQEDRASPVVHGDETTWREDGLNGYFWSFSTARASYFVYRHSRSGDVVEEVMGTAPDTTLTCDFYGAYNRHHGPHQRCWAHLLRAVHELRLRYPEDEALQAWAQAVHTLYLAACACRERLRQGSWGERYDAAQGFQRELLALCAPYLEREVPQRVLCQRCQRFIHQLFHFVVNLNVPPDNNAAERALRPLAVSRKISGGTRTARGSEPKSLLASLFGTWRLQGLNPFVACCKLLASPQV